MFKKPRALKINVELLIVIDQNRKYIRTYLNIFNKINFYALLLKVIINNFCITRIVYFQTVLLF